ncbi:MAG TPA: ATP-binding protein [Thermoanaerobaculia bacterium]|nr:ATP-binding protein [Thermoanaerobaculia bacterium]
MHPLRILLYVSLVIAIAVAWGFGAALHHAGVAQSATITLAVVAFLAFMLPWIGVFLWAVRRAGDLDELVDRSRAVAEGALDKPITDRAYHGEVQDLARAFEETRTMIVRQRKSHEEHRAAMSEIVDSLGEGILAVSPRAKVVVANPRVAEMFGISREDGGAAGFSPPENNRRAEARRSTEIVGKSVVEVVRKQSVVAAIDKALHGETSTDRIALDERQIEIRAFPVAASPDIAAVALFIDVTTIEKLERIRKDFLDDFSHEVRTPLAGLRSAAETLEQGGLAREQEEQLRSVMQRQIARIERLVRDLSDLNQIESGRIALQRRRVNLRDVLHDLESDFQFTLRGGDAFASIDEARLQQVFSNLLENARHHGAGDVDVEVAQENGEGVVRVSDQGPGIPPAELERVFHRFYRVDRSRSRPGTGLGLAIAKHLVALHGGTIRAFNRAEGGATFEVRLPSELT